jgi:DNA-binding transcriptional LysR family regulator
MPRLDDVPFFLALARHKRLSAAARRLEVSHSTISRRVAALEKALGCRLFDKTPHGWELTDAGRRLYADAVRIEATAAEAFGALSESALAPAGTVRLLTTEAFGISVVAPWAARLRRRHPGIKLELLTNSRKTAFSAREFDLAVTFHQPDLADVMVTRLADYGLGLYASRGYLAGRGGSLTREQLADADFVWFIESLQELPELPFPRSLVPDPRVVFYATSVLGQQAAVAAGTGIGLLPHFLAAPDDRLVRLLPDEVSIVQTSWLVVPTESSRSPATRAVARFLHQVSLREPGRLSGGPAGLAPVGEDRPPRRLTAITAGY